MIKNRYDKGSFLAGVILITVVLAILIPAMIKLLQKEAKDTQTEAFKSVALQLAEAGQDRGAWKLRESDQMWLNASTGTVISGYNFDNVYSDMAGGEYKIQFTSGPNNNEVTVLSIGRESRNHYVRAIRAIYTKFGGLVPAISVNSAVAWKPNLIVHWGPVATYQSIDQNPTLYYPRKFSAGQIVGRDVVNDSNNGALPSEDWVNYDYVAFYDLGVPPKIDLDYYADKAANSTIPTLRKGTGSGSANHDPAGSGFVDGDAQMRPPTGGGDYTLDCSTCVIFITGNANFPTHAWLKVEALVVIGDLDYNGDGLTTFTATIPDNASDEYQHSSLGTYFSDQGWSDGGTANIADVGIYGFVYVGGTMVNSGGNAKVVGAIYVNGDVSLNTLTLYYDEDIARNIQTGGSGTMSRVQWDEVIESW